jgi:hypothetical protein
MGAPVVLTPVVLVWPRPTRGRVSPSALPPELSAWPLSGIPAKSLCAALRGPNATIGLDNSDDAWGMAWAMQLGSVSAPH